MKHFKNTLKVIVISFLKVSNLLPLNTGDMCERPGPPRGGGGGGAADPGARR